MVNGCAACRCIRITIRLTKIRKLNLPRGHWPWEVGCSNGYVRVRSQASRLDTCRKPLVGAGFGGMSAANRMHQCSSAYTKSEKLHRKRARVQAKKGREKGQRNIEKGAVFDFQSGMNGTRVSQSPFLLASRHATKNGSGSGLRAGIGLTDLVGAGSLSAGEFTSAPVPFDSLKFRR